MEQKDILNRNRAYWDEYADNWFGVSALPEYGAFTPTENELKLFDDVSGKKLLEICCGSGHSLKYHADRGAKELWGLDISKSQLENADRYLKENGVSAKLICAPMEVNAGIPTDYFDMVYYIYGIGWSTDLQGTFNRIASYLKKGGTFIFCWGHSLHYCAAWSPEKQTDVPADGKMYLTKSYLDEEYFTIPIDGGEMILRNRKISTYVNALANAGFVIERMVEETDSETMNAVDPDDRRKKAQMVPHTVIFKARKL